MGTSEEQPIEERMDAHLASLRPPFDESRTMAIKADLMAMARMPEPEAEVNRVRSYTWAQLAAGLLLLIAFPYVVYLFGQKEVINAGAAEVVHLMPCGSKVTIAPGSSLEYNAASWYFKRSAMLSGSSYFDVVEGDPFKLKFGQGELEVLGTTFSVWDGPRSAIVHCASGKVKVVSERGELLLVKNELSLIKNGALGAKELLVAQSLRPQLTQILNYENVPLTMVCRELEMAMGVMIENKLPAGLRYTGQIDTADPNFVEVLCKPFGAKSKWSSERSVIIEK